MEFLVRQAIRRYLKRHYRREMRSIIARAERIRPKLAKRAPYIGGKENALANNLDMFILFLSYYEASCHRMAGDAIDEIIDDIYRHLRFLDIFMDINRRPFLILLRNYLYKIYLRYAEKVRQKQSKGEWLASWGMSVDPDKTDEGFAFTLIGCPIAEYGK